MEEKIILDRETYKKIKSMNRAEMEKTLKNLYQLGYENALKEGTVDIDTEKLRAELGNIKGIGESRLNEIMSVFEKFISGEPH
ncbi:MAG: hypothetical protein ACI4KR_13145 [Ruminiclostridium sp.]